MERLVVGERQCTFGMTSGQYICETVSNGKSVRVQTIRKILIPTVETLNRYRRAKLVDYHFEVRRPQRLEKSLFVDRKRREVSLVG